MNKSLVLGTAQFGAGYGITNATGRIADDDVAAILARAAQSGVTLFDTAADYGDSQQRLGAVPGAATRRYVTKFSLPADGPVEREALFGRSMGALGVDGLYGVLFHRMSDLRDERCATVLDQLRGARADGTVARVGVSIYDLDDLDLALEVVPDLDLIQLPASVVDRRLIDSRPIADLHANGAEIHTRSALLQGLLLASPESLPPYFELLRPTIEILRRAAEEQGVEVMALLLGYLRMHPVVDAVVFGATNVTEFDGVLAAWASDVITPPELDRALVDQSLPDEVLDPRRWPAVKVV